MPLYEFEIRNGDEILATVALPLPVNDRDSITIERQAVPRGVRVCSVLGTDRDPTIQKNSVLDAAKICERTYGSSDFQRRLGYSTGEFKRIWQNDSDNS